MKLRTHEIEGRNISIYDDIIPSIIHYRMYMYALNSNFKISRTATELPEEAQYQKTLVCYFNIKEVIEHGLFENTDIIEYVRNNKLRLQRYYVNLGTTNDIYTYHTDDNEDVKNKTILCYLNTTWHPTWEGETHFTNNEMKEVIVATSFLPGRVVIFDSAIPHKSSQPSYDAKQFRLAVAVKLKCPESSEYENCICIEDFLYDKSQLLKQINSKEKKAINYLKKITSNIPHSHSTLFNHLLNTFLLLKSYNASGDACLAGLFHSVYGTEFFNMDVNISRDTVIELIGERAEMLVRCFSDPEADYKILSNGFNLDNTTWLDILYVMYANHVEQAHRLSIGFNEAPKFARIKNILEELKGAINNNE